MTLYESPIGTVKNNGYMSHNFEIYRGIRQGCPVSALLFILCVEVLGLKVCQQNELKGFMFGYEEKPTKFHNMLIVKVGQHGGHLYTTTLFKLRTRLLHPES